jgi:hypothetical protein
MLALLLLVVRGDVDDDKLTDVDWLMEYAAMTKGIKNNLISGTN